MTITEFLDLKKLAKKENANYIVVLLDGNDKEFSYVVNKESTVFLRTEVIVHKLSCICAVFNLEKPNENWFSNKFMLEGYESKTRGIGKVYAF